MKFFIHYKSVVNKYGLFFILKYFFFEYYYDYKLGISTCKKESLSNLTINSKNRHQGVNYQPSSYYKLNQIIKYLSITLKDN